jgi:zinc and cadmium transporter
MSPRDIVLWIAVVVVLDGIAALLGALISDRRLARWQPALLGFAAGTLLVSGATELLPDAVARVGILAVISAAGAVAVLWVFERATSGPGHRTRPVSPAALLGSDALHNFTDGIAIAAAFLVSPRAGALTSLAVIAHELPQELADYALLRAAGMSRRRALASLAAVQLTAGAGAASGLLLSASLPGVEGIVLGLAAGMFLYIAAWDLLPELVRSRSRAGLAAFGVAAALALLEL